MSKFNNETLNPGEHFIYNGIEFICLDIIDENYLAITAKVWLERPFDFGNHNNWKESSLCRVLNDKFLDKLNKNHLVKQTSDLVADNGDRKYGTCKDYVTILSCDQYRKYRDLIPRYIGWIWTLTPWSSSIYGEISEDVRVIIPSGRFACSCAHNTHGVAPVCLFSSENLKLRRQASLIGVDEDDEDDY